MNVLDAIRTRRSVRSYAAKPVPAEVMDRMRQTLRLAPSACNIQPWHFIFVTDDPHAAAPGADRRRAPAHVGQ